MAKRTRKSPASSRSASAPSRRTSGISSRSSASPAAQRRSRSPRAAGSSASNDVQATADDAELTELEAFNEFSACPASLSTQRSRREHKEINHGDTETQRFFLYQSISVVRSFSVEQTPGILFS